MPSLTPFWRLLETRANRTAVMADWRRVAGEQWVVVQPLLEPTGRLATFYPTAQGGLRVVHHKDGSIVGVDDEDWEQRRNLTHDDIVLYRVDLSRLRKVISDKLSGIQIARTPVDAADMKLLIGNWEPKKAAAFPIFLLFCSSRPELQQSVVTLMLALPKTGALVLTPTREAWDEDISALARSRRILLVAVQDVLDVADGVLAQTGGWKEYLAAFGQMVETTLPANFGNKTKPARRSQRAANIEKLEQALEEHLVCAKKYACNLREQGRDVILLPRPEQQFLAAQLGMSASDVSRCINDPKALKLRVLWQAALSLEDVLKFRR